MTLPNPSLLHSKLNSKLLSASSLGDSCGVPDAEELFPVLSPLPIAAKTPNINITRIIHVNTEVGFFILAPQLGQDLACVLT